MKFIDTYFILGNNIFAKLKATKHFYVEQIYNIIIIIIIYQFRTVTLNYYDYNSSI